MSAHISQHNKQSGMLLLEGLIAILVFSLGILAIVGMQATTVKEVGDAKYRSDASLLANQLLGTMWVTSRSSATLQNSFDNTGGTNPAALSTWIASVQNTLPGVGPNSNVPIVNITVSPGTNQDGIVTITLSWNSPSEVAAGAPAHKYVAVAQIQ